MLVKLLDDYQNKYNEHNYCVGEIIEVDEIKELPNEYVHYISNGSWANKSMDCIPKKICVII